MPPSEILLNGPIGLEVPKREEVLLDPHKGKLLNIIIDLPPHQFSIDPKLKQSAILEANQ